LYQAEKRAKTTFLAARAAERVAYCWCKLRQKLVGSLRQASAYRAAKEEGAYAGSSFCQPADHTLLLGYNCSSLRTERAFRVRVRVRRGAAALPKRYLSARIVQRCKFAGIFARSFFSRSLNALAPSKRRLLITRFRLEIKRGGWATGNQAPRMLRVRVPVSPVLATWYRERRLVMFFLALIERRLYGLLNGVG
jgi:hypothetical protein